MAENKNKSSPALVTEDISIKFSFPSIVSSYKKFESCFLQALFPKSAYCDIFYE